MQRLFYFFMMILLAQGCASTPKDFDLGPFGSRHEDLNGEIHLKVMGPFYEKTTTPDHSTFQAIRPFHASVHRTGNKKQLSEFCWPLASSKTIGDAYYFRLLTGLYLDVDLTDDESRYRFWLLPFYFQGVDRNAEPYWGVFPLYGSVNEFLGRDKISWTLFPLWFTTELRDVKSKSILWPIYSKTIGRNVYRHRLFPVWGVNQYKDEVKKRFICWPFWNDSTYNFKNNKGSGFMFFPFYGQVETNKIKNKWLFPPFFRLGEGGPSPKSHALWPIIQKSEGEIEKFYIFPLYGKKKAGHVERTFFLWPIFSHRALDRHDSLAKRSYAMPIWQAHTTYLKNGDEVSPEASSVYRKLWPLFSYQRDGVQSRFRFLELWPAKNHGPIERNYAPFWTLFTHHKNSAASDTELLWGMYRKHSRNNGASGYISIFPLIDFKTEVDSAGTKKSWSILKGLMGTEKLKGKRRWRLLYIFKWGDATEDSN